MPFTDSATDSSPDESMPASEEDDSEMNCPLANLQAEQPTTTAAGVKHSLLSLLGSSQALTMPGPEVTTDIASLLSELLRQGLDSEARKNVITAYPLIGNCKDLQPPCINVEISSCLDQQTIKHDTFLSKLQLQLAAGISALAIPLNAQFSLTASDSTEPNRIQLEKMGDPVKILADVFHSLSLHRRHLILPFLDKDLKPILETCPLDRYLFGENLSDKLKTTKDAKRVGATIKKRTRILLPSSSRISPPKRSHTTRGNSSGQGTSSLNYRRYAQSGRLKQQKEGGRLNRQNNRR